MLPASKNRPRLTGQSLDLLRELLLFGMRATAEIKLVAFVHVNTSIGVYR